ncbi:ABC transporter substrate-binding protein [Pseudarthrobacter sp. MEB009]|uniref:ABC transporter substrate-binding protein n=1 Tax=Pseudarthrobacter sp. MEB009 TaxID=3040326 RepID=UPI0025525BBD|nr:ABC transporter substrate-binding protein [Pseudarthrobacter sp. MEB009]
MRKIIGTAAVTAVLALTACTGASQNDPAATAELDIAAIGTPESFSPGNFGTGPTTMFLQPVYDTLFRNDNEGEPTENIVTKWSYDEARTALSLTIREGVKFTDGASLDAEAVKANLDSARKGTGEAGGQLRFIQDVVVKDATNLVVTLSAPDPSLVPNLGGTAGVLASPKALGTPALDNTPVGSGPYVLDAAKSQAGIKYAYTRNADYWNAGDFPFDTIEVTVFNDNNAILNALRAGETDFAVVTDKDSASLESAGLKIQSNPAYTTSGLYLFDRDGTLVPALKEPKVRQAINMALDREAIFTQVFGGKGKATSQVFSGSSDAYVPDLDKKYPFDVAAAKRLLAEAGYPNGFDLPMPDVSPVYPDQQAAVTEALTAIGVKPQYQPVNGQSFISDLLAGKYPAAIFGLNSPRPWDFAQLALTPQSLWNPFHVADQTIVDLVNKAQGETGEAQAATFKELNTYLVDQAWFAPYIQADNVFAGNADITVTPQRYATVPPIWGFTPSK